MLRTTVKHSGHTMRSLSSSSQFLARGFSVSATSNSDVQSVFRPRRSFLYIPGSSEKMLSKSTGTGADTVCLDLEDGVAANKKDEARALVASAVSKYNYGRTECLVRVNAVSIDLGRQDLAYFVDQDRLPHGFVIPKLDTVGEMDHVHSVLSKTEKARGLADNSLVVVGLIESPTAMLNLREILFSKGGSRIGAVIFGGDDYAHAVRATRTSSNSEISFARNWVLMHAAASGVQAIDIVQKNFKDEQALRKECAEAAQWGYTGKQLIHPAQVAVANEVFAPDPKLVSWAERVVAADKAHQAVGTGAFSLDGTMIDAPTVKLAAKIIARAQSCAAVSVN